MKLQSKTQTRPEFSVSHVKDKESIVLALSVCTY